MKDGLIIFPIDMCDFCWCTRGECDYCACAGAYNRYEEAAVNEYVTDCRLEATYD